MYQTFQSIGRFGEVIFVVSWVNFMHMKYIDTHAHLNLSAFNDDVAAVAKQCALDGVVVINVGTKETTSARAVELAAQYEHMYAIIGLHPIQTVPGRHGEEETGGGAKAFVSRGEVFNKEFYGELAKNNKVVGVGRPGGIIIQHSEHLFVTLQEHRLPR